MKKWILSVMMIGLFCIMGGCGSKEPMDEKPGKYDYLIQWFVSDTSVIEKDMKTLGYNTTGRAHRDAEATEKYLEDYIYGEWYKEGKNTPIEISESNYDGIEYGVYYVISLNSLDVIKLFDLTNEENVFYMEIRRYTGRSNRRYLYTTLDVRDGDGNHLVTYRDVSQVDYEILMQLDEENSK